MREVALRLETTIAATRADLIEWMFGTIGFQALIILGAVVTRARLIG